MVGIGAIKKLSFVEKPRQMREFSVYQGTKKVGTVMARSKSEARDITLKQQGVNVKQRKRAYSKYLKSTGKR